MADWTRFWDAISKFGDQLYQKSMWDYQQQAEEARANRERDLQAKREQAIYTTRHISERAEQLSDVADARAFTEKMDIESRIRETKQRNDERNFDVVSEAFANSRPLVNEGMQAAVSRDPEQIERFQAKLNVIKKARNAEKLTPAEEAFASASLDPVAYSGFTKLKLASEQVRLQREEVNVSNGYRRALTDQINKEGKVTMNSLLSVEGQMNTIITEVNKIHTMPDYAVLQGAKIKAGGGLLAPELEAKWSEYQKMENALAVHYRELSGLRKYVAEAIGYKLTPTPAEEAEAQKKTGGQEAPVAGGQEAPVARKENFGQGLVRSAGEVGSIGAEIANKSPDEIINAISGAVGKVQGVSQKMVPMSPKIPSQVDTAIRKKYSVPAGASIHYAQGNEILTKQNGQDVVMKREDLRLIAKPEDYLWDSLTGKLYKLSLMLGDVQGKTDFLDAEDEIFK